MSEKEWAVLYTDEQYLLRNEVMKAMNTSLIDGYWADILAYRKSKMIPFSFKSITNHPFYLTATEAIKGKITQFELVSARFASVLKKINDPHEELLAERACFLAALRAISSIENAQMSELSLKALLNGTYQENNPFHQPVIGYKNALSFYRTERDISTLHPNDDFLAEALGKCLGASELTSFYRTSDFDMTAQRNRYLYNPDYSYAPHDFIETLMADFLSWVKRSDDVSYFVKAVAAIYYLDYVQPFGERNDEMAALLSKAIYATSEASREAFLIPFEAILIKNARYKNLALETQRSGDLTYLVLYAIGVLSPLLESLSEEIKSIKIDTYRSEFSTLSPEENALAKTKETPSPEQLSLFAPEAKTPAKGVETAPSAAPIPTPLANPNPAPAVASSPIIPQETPAPAPQKVEPTPIRETPVAKVEATSVSAPQVVPVTPKVEKPLVSPERKIAPEEMENAVVTEESALSVESNPLSEKEVKEYVQYLLETNPTLNKNQASFLANHCTIGRYYTIQQFKKFARCAYETARTSMDKLASERYYTKLQVKNKFVYTPIKKGEK